MSINLAGGRQRLGVIPIWVGANVCQNYMLGQYFRIQSIFLLCMIFGLCGAKRGLGAAGKFPNGDPVPD